MARKVLHRIQPQKTINRIRINPDTLTPQQREETLSRIQVPVTAVFTEGLSAGEKYSRVCLQPHNRKNGVDRT